MNEEKEKKEEIKTLEVDNFNWILPECCRSESGGCQHTPKRERPKKVQIAL